VGLRVASGLDELDSASLACLKRCLGQPSAKEFVSKPHTIRVEHIAFTVFGNLPDVTVAVVLLDFCPRHAIGPPRQPHYTTEFVQGRLRLRTERGQHVAQIDCVLGVPVEVRTPAEARCCNSMDHGAVTKDRKIERRPVESDELR
jgi:hypothetical protein